MKSQIQAQIFVYILALVIGAGILIYGYNAIKGFRTQADDVMYLEFENTIKNDLKTISFESTKVKTYELPAAVKQVCFKAKGAVYADVTLEEQRQGPKTNYKYPLIASAISAGTDNNVFIYPKGEKAFYTGIFIEFGENDQTGNPKQFKCFDVKSNVLKIKIKGQGKSVLITE